MLTISGRNSTKALLDTCNFAIAIQLAIWLARVNPCERRNDD
jgi:hypothetical protein